LKFGVEEMFEKRELIKEIRKQEKTITELLQKVATYKQEENQWYREKKGLKEHISSFEKQIEFLKKKNDEFLKGTKIDGIEYKIMNYAFDKNMVVTLPQGATILGIEEDPFSKGPDKHLWTVKCLIKKENKEMENLKER